MWERVVLNLISNAFKYTLEGSIEVVVRSVAGAGVELLVADTGVGIPAAELPHIFDRFHRIEGQPGRTMEGTGIGLALVNELVRLHGGMIDVQSRLGEGTAVRVTLAVGIFPSASRPSVAGARPHGADGRRGGFVRRRGNAVVAGWWSAKP